MTWTILALYGMACVGFTIGWITCAAMAHHSGDEREIGR